MPFEIARPGHRISVASQECGAAGLQAAAGTRHEIGGGAGWIVQGAYDDITAAVGDILSFSYTGGYHDVMLVDNGNCDFSGGTMLDGECSRLPALLRALR